jgi:hypothetical protein
MRRVIVPALLAVAMVASSSANASAFGLFDKLCNKGGCDTCCDIEPVCGCEAPCAPTCGCEVVESSCDPCAGACAKPKCGGLLARLFSRHHGGCDTGCCEVAYEPVCGCEAPCEPACGLEAPCAPACGCEAVDPCCNRPSCCDRIKGLFSRMFKKNSCCDSGCEPACGCEVACEPVCGCEAPCEPTCGCEPSCGCGL